MTLYRYLGTHWIETLEEHRFKMADVDEFNDPFDGRGRCVGSLVNRGVEAFSKAVSPLTVSLLGKETAVKACEQTLKNAVRDRTLFSEVKVLCFSTCDDGDPAQKLMWAHYADGYKGVRIGLQLEDPNFPLYLDSVKYCHERPALDLCKVKSLQNDEETFRFWTANLTTKSCEWAYEREWRIIADEQHLISRKDDKGRVLWFWSFEPRVLRSVDIGCMMPQCEVDKIVAVVRARYPDVRVRKVVLDEISYGITYETIHE